MKPIYVDVESAPIGDSEALERLKPAFEAPRGYKDPEKIAEALRSKEAQWRANLALDATTAQILCIGFLGEQFKYYSGATEKDILAATWSDIDYQLAGGGLLIGFNILAWDFPMLVRRSYANGVKVPPIIFGYGHSRIRHEGIIDLMDLWMCGNRQDMISLNTLSVCLGGPGKSGSGADFASLWKSDRSAALAYLSNDLSITKFCAERMGVL